MKNLDLGSLSESDQKRYIVNPAETILVTGANGFIGSRVVRTLLSYGFKNVRCFARPTSNSRKLETVASDFSLENIDTSDFIVTEQGERVSVQKGAGQTFTSHDKISDFGTSIRRALAEGEFGFSFFDEYNKSFIKLANPISLEQEIQDNLQHAESGKRI